MIKKILILTDTWGPASANVTCVKNVINCIKDDIHISVSAFEGPSPCPQDKYRSLDFHTIAPTRARQLYYLSDAVAKTDPMLSNRLKAKAAFFSKLNRIKNIFSYPITCKSFSIKWAKQIETLLQKQHFDCIISVCAPEESMYTGYLIKQKYPQIKWLIHLIDEGSHRQFSSNFYYIEKMLAPKSMFQWREFIKASDGIIIMKCHENHYRLPFFKEVQDKITVLDVPLLQTDIHSLPASTLDKEFNTNIENWVYTGNLNTLYYNPEPICRMFLKYSENKNAMLHFFGRGDATTYITKMQEKYPTKIKFWGFCQHDQISTYLQNANVLIYWRSKPMSSVSGKFFDYLSYGKPIIYFTTEQQDVNTPYVSKYTGGLIVRFTDSLEEQIAQIDNFLCKKPVIDIDEVKKLYYASTPQATAAYIQSKLFNKSTN